MKAPVTPPPVAATKFNKSGGAPVEVSVNFRPWKDRILIREVEFQKVGSIWVPPVLREDKQTKALVGVIVRTHKSVDAELSSGTMVMFGHFPWALIYVEGKEHYLVTEKEIYGIIPAPTGA